MSLSLAVDYVKAFFRKGAFWFSKNRQNSDTFHGNHAVFKLKRRLFQNDTSYEVNDIGNAFITLVAF